MSLKKDERLPETVLQLSDLMRYFLYESKDNYVPLEKELASLDNYIALQRLRSGKHFQLEIERMGEAGDRKIAPLLLITFLENAFKHGAKGSSGDTFIKLFIGIEKDELNFVVENNKGSVDEVRLVGHSGLGLENVKRQLVLLYPSRHTLKIKDEPARFIIQLQLHL